MQGGTAVLYDYWDGSKTQFYNVYYSMQPGIISDYGGDQWYQLYVYRVDGYGANGELAYTHNYDPAEINSSSIRKGRHYLYGDWRYKDDTQAPTDDVYTDVSDYDFDDVPVPDLEELIKNILEELERQQPDLSSIEGLLKAIYNRLGTLDSDNDNALLSQILAAINALEINSGDNNNGNSDSGSNGYSDLISVLEDIKNSLVFNNGEDIDTLSEQLRILIDSQLTVGDFVIDDDLYNTNLEILKLHLQQKFSFVSALKNLVDYAFNAYQNSSDKPRINFSLNSKEYHVDIDVLSEDLLFIRFVIAAFIYISYAYHTYRKIPSYINGGDNE